MELSNFYDSFFEEEMDFTNVGLEEEMDFTTCGFGLQIILDFLWIFQIKKGGFFISFSVFGCFFSQFKRIVDLGHFNFMEMSFSFKALKKRKAKFPDQLYMRI